MKTTLLLTTYNWPEALELILLSIKSQSIMPSEIVIADDGSAKETKSLISEYTKKIPVPIKHIWHEDTGFTKTVILNKAIQKITSDYIIQIDGDVILHKHFIKDHIRLAEENTYLFGSRVSLTKEASEKIITHKKTKLYSFSKGLQRRGRAIYLPLLGNYLSKKSTSNSGKLRGCNMSYWKKDALYINGYNEDFIGWGYEDFNFAQRLLHAGITSKRIKHVAIQFHLYHPEAPKGDTTIGDALQFETLKNKTTACKNGITKA